ncbi:MAG: hypothetical protein NZV14_03755 [Bryobacteraceae bacterium]|nr:hypothetical protein [Bryobacteraceae bacterium]MDW8377247.1 hypothetical protein [Bryobacterales bacterium]
MDHLNFHQFQMLKLGTVGLAAVKNRLAAGLGPTDGPAQPLTKRYAIYRSKRRKRRAVRHLSLTGNILCNLSVRTVNDPAAKAALSSRRERIKGLANQRREPWLVFSPRNRAAVVVAARRMLRETTPQLLVERMLGGRPR